ncbi:MAG: NAD-glutamate dehydrogenase [Desulfobacteraceae bacterium]|nr:NAD-glutamate dehydrogenase [Desulfobacteraceae bacterium]
MTSSEVDDFNSTSAESKATCRNGILKAIEGRNSKASADLPWLLESMPPYFFITMRDEVEALTNLLFRLRALERENKITLSDQPNKLIVARLDVRGSLHDTLKPLFGREFSYVEFTHSNSPVPGCKHNLEILRFDFDRKSHEEIASAGETAIPARVKKDILKSLKELYPGFDSRSFIKDLHLLAANKLDYVLLSPPERVARTIRLYRQGIEYDGLFLDVERTDETPKTGEYRVLFSVANPPQGGFLTQTMEVFKRLGLGVRRSYCLNISNGLHWNFQGNFYVTPYDGQPLTRDSQTFTALQRELYNTQILSTENAAYSVFVTQGMMNGEEASLVNAFVAFCQTTLAHSQPDRFDLETVKSSLFSDPATLINLIALFKARFDPDSTEREMNFERMRKTVSEAIENYNTGHRYLDDIRRTIFRTCLFFITYTLKTNYFIPQKHALAFRLDPAYLARLGPEFTRGLPRRTPFRITFFFGRRGFGYHIGFSDIARGGWRTLICRTQDELVTNTNNLFREVFVLAHTQHLKNKDIYEGGSKMISIVNAVDEGSAEAVTQQVYKLQYGFTNAFLDLFVTANRKAVDRRVVDYYGDDEPIELGPDENMHDAMIEFIARQAEKRGYILGIALMSGKQVGINHKHYGVTSRGVIRAASIAMQQIGIAIERDPFTVKLTGGPTGDVGGNSIKLLLRDCPQARILCVTDASGALYDPQGADRETMADLVHQNDIADFDPQRLNPGGFILFSRHTRKDALKLLYRKLLRTETGVEENWITLDQYRREIDNLLFATQVDLFLPCGGRPETIDAKNCGRFFMKDGSPSAKVIVEGANSFISPEAREAIQKGGTIILRDSSANKCGVISSSYEIIVNLLLTEKEFLKHKEAYVQDVLKILDIRAEAEARLIFRRHAQAGGSILYTDISSAISEEINSYYDQLFAYFQNNPDVLEQPLLLKACLRHMPALIQETPKFRARVAKLPLKIRCAVLASEIASSIVYHGGWEVDLETKLERFLNSMFQPATLTGNTPALAADTHPAS